VEPLAATAGAEEVVIAAGAAQRGRMGKSGSIAGVVAACARPHRKEMRLGEATGLMKGVSEYVPRGAAPVKRQQIHGRRRSAGVVDIAVEHFG
jgi:hypothetical protein